jgi:hypothetical protein
MSATSVPLSQAFASEERVARNYGLLFLLLFTHVALFLLQLPTIYEFATFAVFDPGAALRADKLIVEGYLPLVDFGYPYGLLPLLLGRAFFAALGRTPAAYLAFMLVAEAAILWGLWRLARHWSWTIALFLLISLPHIVIPVYINLIHPLEAALMLHALADLTTGRRARALAIATASLFVKPVMAYVLGFLVIVLMMIRLAQKRERVSALCVSLLPAALTGIVCALLSAGRFGFWPTWNALFPGNGSHSYETLHFGLFGNGRRFWLPQLTTLAQFAKYYALTPAGFWIVCTLLIVVFGVLSLRKLWQAADTPHETMLIVAACHGIFLCTFFGWPGTWTYYSSLLIAGVALGLYVHGASRPLIAALVLLALLGHVERYQIATNAWRWMQRSPDTVGLWAFDNMRDEWKQARAIAGTRRILNLSNGCAELLFPNMDAPASFFLEPGLQKPIEIERLRRQLQQAEVVVTFNQGEVLDPWHWKEFADERNSFVDSWRGVYLTVHERRATVAPGNTTNQL